MGWRQLSDIAQEASELKRDDEESPPEACPFCGEPLDEAPGGGLFCPFAGDHSFRWP